MLACGSTDGGLVESSPKEEAVDQCAIGVPHRYVSGITAGAAGGAPIGGKGLRKPATGASIAVGGLGTASGRNDSEGAPAAQANFACLSASGGIHGAPNKGRGLATNHEIVGTVGDSYLGCPVAKPIYGEAGLGSVSGRGVGHRHACSTAEMI
jgi:hypothetical protein